MISAEHFVSALDTRYLSINNQEEFSAAISEGRYAYLHIKCNIHLEDIYKKIGDDISSWDMSECHDMSYMFRNCYQFNSDLSAWDVSACTDMDSMFDNCYQFNSDLSTWNVSACTDMCFMFRNCHKFDSDLSTWDVSACKYKLWMIENCDLPDEKKPQKI